MWPYFTVPIEGNIRQVWLYLKYRNCQCLFIRKSVTNRQLTRSLKAYVRLGVVNFLRQYFSKHQRCQKERNEDQCMFFIRYLESSKTLSMVCMPSYKQEKLSGQLIGSFLSSMFTLCLMLSVSLDCPFVVISSVSLTYIQALKFWYFLLILCSHVCLDI